MSWLDAIGPTVSGAYLLGCKEVPVYAVQAGESWVLIEGGLSGHSKVLLQQLRELTEGQLERVSHWLVTHSHYDHCGSLPYVAPFLPNVQILASGETAAAFRSDRARRVVKRLNASVVEELGFGEMPKGELATRSVAANALSVRTVSDGQPIDLGGDLLFQVVATPGHAACQLAFHEPKRDWLFVSDAIGGLNVPGEWCPLAFQDSALYAQSLAKLEALKPKTLFLGHGGVFTDLDASVAFGDAKRAHERVYASAISEVESGKYSELQLAEQLTNQLWSGSARFVTRELHVKSMLVMVQLMLRERMNKVVN